MSGEQNITLFDVSSKGYCACWSPNTWKSSQCLSSLTIIPQQPLLTLHVSSHTARLFLNYKGIPYTTQWIEISHIATHFKSLGIPPNPSSPGSRPYTVPAIRFPDGTYVMESKNIAVSLEEKYPSPSLHLDSPQLAKIEALLPQLFIPLRGVVTPKIGRNLMTQESEPYFYKSRAEKFGMPLDQMDREMSGEKQWEEARPVIREVAALIEEKGGPFVLGREVSYADFILVGALSLFKRLGEGVFERVVEMEPVLRALYAASGKWLEKDN
ncbi:MAG: hypothetical protein Q9168_006290 [Polycauliona sp. 1 TL-2023]